MYLTCLLIKLLQHALNPGNLGLITLLNPVDSAVD